jgi:hypothetical protein
MINKYKKVKKTSFKDYRAWLLQTSKLRNITGNDSENN